MLMYLDVNKNEQIKKKLHFVNNKIELNQKFKQQQKNVITK